MKLFTFAIIALMLSGSAMAAEVPTSAGDKAMVFMFSGLDALSLGGYGEYGVGMRYYIADEMAVRAGVVFGTYSKTEEHSAATEADDEEISKMMLGLEAVIEKHLEGPCASISPYLGVGGLFKMSSTDYCNSSWDELDIGGNVVHKYRDEETDKALQFGGFATVGFEWAFTNCMTLGGEYRLGMLMTSGETEYEETSTDSRAKTKNKWSETTMGFNTASVYLSVYW